MGFYLFTYTFPNALDNFTAPLEQVSVQARAELFSNDYFVPSTQALVVKWLYSRTELYEPSLTDLG
jgi:hypothetical protein